MDIPLPLDTVTNAVIQPTSFTMHLGIKTGPDRATATLVDIDVPVVEMALTIDQVDGIFSVLRKWQESFAGVHICAALPPRVLPCNGHSFISSIESNCNQNWICRFSMRGTASCP